METIKGVELLDIVKEASEELVEESKRKATNQVKSLLSGIVDLNYRIEKAEKELVGMKDNLNKKNAIVEKLRSGDWSALKVEEVKPEQK